MLLDAVLRSDEILERIDWPRLKEIDIPYLDRGECLFICAGFEDRAIDMLHRIVESTTTGPSLGLIRYLPEQEENKFEEMQQLCRKAGLKVTEFFYDRRNPAGIGDELLRFSKEFSRVLIDISGMSRLLIVQAIVTFIRRRVGMISLYYSEAANYPPSKDEFDRKTESDSTEQGVSYLSSGIFEIAATPELSSVSMLGEAIRLVAFPSFDPAQLTNLVQELQPTYTDVIHGVPPDQNNEWRTEAIRQLNERTLNELYGKTDQSASTLDYREALRILLSIYARRSMFDRLVVAPTGSKMQSVAVGLFRAVLHDVQIVYPTPHVFPEPEKYTLGVRQMYQLDLPTDAIWDAIKDVEADEDEPHWVSR